MTIIRCIAIILLLCAVWIAAAHAQAPGSVTGTIILQGGQAAPFTGQITLPSPTPTPVPSPTPASNPVTMQAGLTGTGQLAIACADSIASNAWVNISLDGANPPQFSSSIPSGAFVSAVTPGAHQITCTGYHWSNGPVLDGATNATVTIRGAAPTPSPTPGPPVMGENRPDNTVANNTVPSAAWLATYKAAVANGQGCPGPGHPCEIQPAILQSIDPSFTGTTDEELAHYAAMCNLDPDWVRADAVWETNWHQNAVGDCSNDPSECSSDGGSGISLGILQIKSIDYPASCPSVASAQTVSSDTDPGCMSHLSTPFAIAFRIADWCNAKNGGAQGYIEDGRDHGGTNGLPSYPAAVAAHNPDYDKYFMAIWGPGDWGSAGFWTYVNGVQAIYNQKPWLQPAFLKRSFAFARGRHIQLKDAHKQR